MSTDEELRKIHENEIIKPKTVFNKNYRDFHLLEIPRLVNILNNISGVNYIYINDIYFNNKKYEIVYEDDSVFFVCEDGRELSCYYDPINGFFRVNHYFANGDSILFKNRSVYHDPTEPITIYDLISDLEFKFSSVNPSFCATIEDIDCYLVEDEKIVFDIDSISYLGREISLDGNTLLNDEVLNSIPIDKIEKYRHDKERHKAIRVITDSDDLNPLTKANLLAAVNRLSKIDIDSLASNDTDKKDIAYNISNIVFFGKYDMPICRKVIELRKNLISKYYRSNTLSGDEITHLTSVFQEGINHINEDLGIQKIKKEGLN